MCDCLLMEMITNDIRRTCFLGICLLLLLLVSPVSNAQDYYSNVGSLEYAGVRYRISHYEDDVFIENAANNMRDHLRYKIGSDPVVYYSYATGMGHLAESDSVAFDKIVRKVFSEDEIKEYTDCRGGVFLTYVVDPVNGRVLEVHFRIKLRDGDETLLSIPIRKFYELEMLIKQHLVCHISEELKAERQSYTLSGDDLFIRKRRVQSKF